MPPQGKALQGGGARAILLWGGGEWSHDIQAPIALLCSLYFLGFTRQSCNPEEQEKRNPRYVSASCGSCSGAAQLRKLVLARGPAWGML